MQSLLILIAGIVGFFGGAEIGHYLYLSTIPAAERAMGQLGDGIAENLQYVFPGAILGLFLGPVFALSVHWAVKRLGSKRQ